MNCKNNDYIIKNKDLMVQSIKIYGIKNNSNILYLYAY